MPLINLRMVKTWNTDFDLHYALDKKVTDQFTLTWRHIGAMVNGILISNKNSLWTDSLGTPNLFCVYYKVTVVCIHKRMKTVTYMLYIHTCIHVFIKSYAYYTVKRASAATSMKQSLALKGHLFLVLS
jgi:hypothetical protein